MNKLSDLCVYMVYRDLHERLRPGSHKRNTPDIWHKFKKRRAGGQCIYLPETRYMKFRMFYPQQIEVEEVIPWNDFG